MVYETFYGLDAFLVLFILYRENIGKKALYFKILLRSFGDGLLFEITFASSTKSSTSLSQFRNLHNSDQKLSLPLPRNRLSQEKAFAIVAPKYGKIMNYQSMLG